MKDILILTASFGMGHHTAMRTIHNALTAIAPNITIEVADIYDITTPKLKKPLSNSYGFLTKTSLPIYNPLYSMRNGKYLRMDDIMVLLFYRKFERLMQKLQPKVIISVFPTGAEFAAHYKRTRDARVMTCTVITDIVANWEWIHEATSLYAVPVQQVKDALIEKGVNPDAIFVTGVPVHPLVTSAKTGGTVPEDMASEIMVSKDLPAPRVLIVGSAMGNIKLGQNLLAYMASSSAHFHIVTGNDIKLFNTLQALNLPDNITVEGFVKNLPERMLESQIVITKPGGATVFEAIACKVPLLVFKSTIKQEAYNVSFLEQEGLGLSFDNETALIEGLDFLIENAPKRKEIISKMAQLEAQMHLPDFLNAIVDRLSEEETIDLQPKGLGLKNLIKEKELFHEIRAISEAFKTRRISNRQ